jgi:primosomal protein N' (replication factor Y)
VVPVATVPATPDVAVHPTLPAPVTLPDQPRRLVVWPPTRTRAELVRALLALEGSTIVVAPDRAEHPELVDAIRSTGRPVVELHGDAPAAARAEAWREARRGATVVVGGRAAAFAPVPDLAAAVVLDDADEALAEERAPTWHARDVVLERARRDGAVTTLVTPAPTVEALAACGAPTVPAAGAPRGGWPILDVVDRRAERPGLGLLGERLGDALHEARRHHGRAVCVLNRRGRAHLLVCRQCGEVARCPRCGAALTEHDAELACPRGDSRQPRQCAACGAPGLRPARPGVRRLRDDLAALLPRARVSVAEAGSPPDPSADVVVGTEAALHQLAADRPVRLVAYLDVDQELLAPRFRAAEQALWLLVRGARLLGDPRAGGRLLVQTRVPDHEVLGAARTGDPLPLARAETDRRQALRLPPFGGLAALSGTVEAVAAAAAALRDHLEVLGPVDGQALVRAPSSAALADRIAAVDLAPARARGRLRVDVDPQRV